MRIKICGINDPIAFDTVVDAGADYVGFVFFPPSPRYVTPDQAAALSARHRGGPLRVGLFVDPTEPQIADAIGKLHLDVLQVYGTIDATRLSAHFGLPVWRAVGIAGASDLPVRTEGADALLIEAKAAPDASRPGGNAQSFDWSLLRGWKAPGPWILAGGLTAKNVGSAIRLTGATAVDVASGVERRRGEKDPELIRAFIAAARAEES
jgi:phosphoribosylanthranilate isomerase